MNKKMIKKVLILIILNIFILCVGFSFAYEKINPPDYSVGTITGTNKITNLANDIIAVIRIIGSIVSIVIFVWIGVRYMTASIEEKVQYKESLKPYFIGAIMLFGITNILAIISDIISKL